MKLIEVIVGRVFSDFVNKQELQKEANLYLDLKLSEADIELIRKRIESIFNVRIPSDFFINKSTYGEILDFVHEIYIKTAKLTKVSIN